MKFKILFILLLFSISLSAKKFPKWKEGNFKTTASGLQYKIVKKGKGDSIGPNDSVTVEYAIYNKADKKIIFTTQKLADVNKIHGYKFMFSVSNEAVDKKFRESVRLLKEGGSGYFIYSSDSSKKESYYFIRIYKVIHNYDEFLPIIESQPIDTAEMNFHIPDPEKKNYGDTLFTTMQLVEVPMKVSCHGIAPTLQAVKFKVSYFDNGVQHKEYLVFIECPDGYGKDFLEAGKSYVITAIPLMENHKQGHQVQNSYTVEKLDSYYCLRIRKMN